MKAVIDTGTMITLSGTCLMNVFRRFVQVNKIELFISETIAQESVWTPISNKRFALNAARIKKIMNDGTLKLIPRNGQINNYMEKILYLTNNSFIGNSGPMTIIQRGEAEALAIAKSLGAQAIFVDERTTRALLESPVRMKEVLERRQNQSIKLNMEKVEAFKEMFPKIKCFRSIDLIALAYEQDLFNHELEHGKLELEAAMYAAKFAGCAVSEKEIQEYLTQLRK